MKRIFIWSLVSSVMMLSQRSLAACDSQSSLIESFLQRHERWVEVETKGSAQLAKKNIIVIDVNFKNPKNTKVVTFKDQKEFAGGDYKKATPRISKIQSICVSDRNLEIAGAEGNATLSFSGKNLSAEVSKFVFSRTFYFKKL